MNNYLFIYFALTVLKLLTLFRCCRSWFLYISRKVCIEALICLYCAVLSSLAFLSEVCFTHGFVSVAMEEMAPLQMEHHWLLPQILQLLAALQNMSTVVILSQAL